MTSLPAPPTPRLSEYGVGLANELTGTKATLKGTLSAEEEARQATFASTKALQGEVLGTTLALKNGRLDLATAALDRAWQVVDAMAPIPSQPSRPGSVASLLEELVAAQSFLAFFQTGRLLRKSQLRSCVDDSEYLGGVIQFSQELGEYAVGRSMAQDVASVSVARDLVDALNGQLMGFDFRNGPLRRKYDSVKYALKRLEDLLYEQSLMSDKTDGGDSPQPQGKRARLVDESASGASADAAPAEGQPGDRLPAVDEAEFAAMRTRFEEADAAREAVIKGCRDGQKLSKLAIYSIHRGQLDKAAAQLEEVDAKTRALLPTVRAFPTLRPGSFANVLEEYAEAKLFLHWMLERKLLPLDRMPLLERDEREPADSGSHDTGAYIGGLVDLTGELGRYAVACGTARKAGDVEQCFEATCVVSNLLAELPSSFALKKKGGAVATNLRKLGQVRYELSLAKRGRSKALVDTAEEGAPSQGGAAAGAEEL